MILFNGRDHQAIRVISTRQLMPRKSLCLVEVRGREYLLGLGNDQVTLIAAMDQDPTPSSNPSFQQVLNQTDSKNTAS